MYLPITVTQCEVAVGLEAEEVAQELQGSVCKFHRPQIRVTNFFIGLYFQSAKQSRSALRIKQTKNIR